MSLIFLIRGAETKMCWGVIFLLGGGFALASASQKSGLSGKKQFSDFKGTISREYYF
jgi:hypothetical protein